MACYRYPGNTNNNLQKDECLYLIICIAFFICRKIRGEGMKNMRIKKVLNNNVVIAEDKKNGREKIVMSNAWDLRKKRGTILSRMLLRRFLFCPMKFMQNTRN